MATTARKTTPARKAPQDRQPKQPTAAERAAAEINGYTVTLDGVEYQCKDPLDWPAGVDMSLGAGQLGAWAIECLHPDEDLEEFIRASAHLSKRDIVPAIRDLLTMGAQAMGEEINSQRS